MQRGRKGRDNNFEPSNAFSGVGDFGGFGFHRNGMPSLFGGRDPFDDPFFTRPFGSIFGPGSASSYMQKTSNEKGIIIEELDSDDEGGHNLPERGEGEDLNQKTSGSAMDSEPSVEHPDDDDDDAERKNKSVTCRNDHYKAQPAKAGKSSFQTSRVTYGGVDGTYYSSSRSRRIGADGVVLEENKEADTTTGQATHRISRGIHDKGHSLTRRLNSDGKVDSMHTLHNLNEDELAGFEEAWKGNSTGQLPGWKDGYDVHRNERSAGSSDPARNQIWGGWAFPSFEQSRRAGGFGKVDEANTNTGGRTKKVVRINID